MTSFHSYRFLQLVAFLLFMGGCDVLSPDRPEEARLDLQGMSGSEVLLITSTNFLSQRVQVVEGGVPIDDSLNVILFVSDTSVVQLPFEQSYDISEFERFYAEIQRLDPSNDLLYSRAWIDNDLRMDKRPAASEETVVFSYDFRIANGEDPDVTF